MKLLDVIPAIKKSSVAQNIDDRARHIVKKAQRILNKEKNTLQANLQDYGALKIDVLRGVIYDFVELFEQLKEVELSEKMNDDEFSKICIDHTELSQLREASITMRDLTTGGIASITSGALTGAAVYGSVGMIATHRPARLSARFRAPRPPTQHSHG